MTLEEFKEVCKNAEKLMDLYEKEFKLAHAQVEDIASKANGLMDDLYNALDEVYGEGNYLEYENLFEASNTNRHWLPSDYQCM